MSTFNFINSHTLRNISAKDCMRMYGPFENVNDFIRKQKMTQFISTMKEVNKFLKDSDYFRFYCNNLTGDVSAEVKTEFATFEVVSYKNKTFDINLLSDDSSLGAQMFIEITKKEMLKFFEQIYNDGELVLNRI